MPQSEALTDGALFRLARNGDRAAFGELVDRHKDALVNYLTRAAGCRDRAEDLAQDAFLRLFERGQGYIEQGKLRAYLFRIATNLLRSQSRRERRWEILRTVFPPASGHGPYRSPQMRLLHRELEQQVESALLSVPLRFRVPPGPVPDRRLAATRDRRTARGQGRHHQVQGAPRQEDAAGTARTLLAGERTMSVSRRSTHDLDLTIDEALEQLPKETASPGFTRRVLARLEDPSRALATRTAGGGFDPVRLAIGTALLLLLVAGLVLRSTGSGEQGSGEQRPGSPAPVTRAAEIRGEYRALQAEIESLRRSLEADSPTLYLASDGGVDLVVDVAELAALTRFEGRRSGIRYAKEEKTDEESR